MDVEVEFSQHLFRAALMIVAVAGVLFLFYLTIIASCYFCPCCVFYRKSLFFNMLGVRHTQLPQPVTNSSIASGTSAAGNTDWSQLISRPDDLTNNNQPSPHHLTVPVHGGGNIQPNLVNLSQNPNFQQILLPNSPQFRNIPREYFPHPSIPNYCYQNPYFDNRFPLLYGNADFLSPSPSLPARWPEVMWNPGIPRRHHSFQANLNRSPPLPHRHHSLQINPSYGQEPYQTSNYPRSVYPDPGSYNATPYESPTQHGQSVIRKTMSPLENTLTPNRGISQHLHEQTQNLGPVRKNSFRSSSIASITSTPAPTEVETPQQIPTAAMARLSKFENIAASIAAIGIAKGGYESELLGVFPSDGVSMPGMGKARRGSGVCELLYGGAASTPKAERTPPNNHGNNIEETEFQKQNLENSAFGNQAQISNQPPLLVVSEDEEGSVESRGFKDDEYPYTSTSSSSSSPTISAYQDTKKSLID